MILLVVHFWASFPIFPDHLSGSYICDFHIFSGMLQVTLWVELHPLLATYDQSRFKNYPTMI